MDIVSFTAADAGPKKVLSALTKAGFAIEGQRPVRRTLLDTFDARLHHAGLRLEMREGPHTELILRGGGPVPAQVPVEVAPRLATDLPAGPLRARVGPLLDVRALMPVLAMGAREATAVRRNNAGKVVAAVRVYTEGTAGPATSLLPLVAEVAPFEGFPAAAEEAGKLLRSLGLSRREGDAIDALAGHVGVDLGGFSGSPSVAMKPSEPATIAFRRVLANLAETIDANWQGTIDDTDSEFLHDLRVAVRRTRSVLSHARGVLPSDGREYFRAEFGWLGAVTTPQRDLDVYLIEWPSYVAPLGAAATELAPVVGHILRRRMAAHVKLVRVLRSARYRAVMTGWRAWIGGAVMLGASAKRAEAPIGGVVAARLAKAQEQLVGKGRAIDAESPAESLHELRKDAKKLRYLLECFGGLLPTGPRKTFVQRLKALQDNLGEHQDTEVHTAQLRALSEELHGEPGMTAEVLVAMGRLTEVFDQRRKEARGVFAERFAAYDTDQTAQALAKLLSSAATS